MAGKIHHWKHGWIPLDAEALAEKDHGHPSTKARAQMLAVSTISRLSRIEPAVTAQLQQEVTAAGGHLEGLHNRLKEQDSLARKLVTKSEQRGTTPEAEAKHIGDALRYTMIFPKETYSQRIKDIVAHLTAQGFTAAVENNWPRGTVYKGVNANLTDRSGNTFELQFHTPESFAQKKAQHGDYKIMRDPKRPVAERKAAYARMLGNWNNVPVPGAINSVEPIVDPKPVTF